jgi:hypothetical protein
MTAESLATLERHGRTIWLGQSVDTSVLHSDYPELATVPLLTSIGCAIRKPHRLLPKFHASLRQRLSAGGRLAVDSGGFVLMTKSTLPSRLQIRS